MMLTTVAGQSLSSRLEPNQGRGRNVASSSPSRPPRPMADSSPEGRKPVPSAPRTGPHKQQNRPESSAINSPRMPPPPSPLPVNRSTPFPSIPFQRTPSTGQSSLPSFLASPPAQNRLQSVDPQRWEDDYEMEDEQDSRSSRNKRPSAHSSNPTRPASPASLPSPSSSTGGHRNDTSYLPFGMHYENPWKTP